MTDPLVVAAGPAPARGAAARWRQVALLATSVAVAPRSDSLVGLAATLCALDCPEEAAHVAARIPDDPWATWWGLMAAGQRDGLDGLDSMLSRLEVPGDGPDSREVGRRIEDLRVEIDDLRGTGSGLGRFAIIGSRERPDRRVLVVGRSSASFIVTPAWDSLSVVRLGPSDGPSAGNRAHSSILELIAAIRRGEGGGGREVPADVPNALDPEAFLEGLRPDGSARDRQLMELAAEVREERERLVAERAKVERDRAAVGALLRRAEQARTAPAVESVALPTTPSEAAQLLDIAPGSSQETVERAWRSQVQRCHPDRVADLHPDIRGRAEGLTVALNAAREILTGSRSARPARR
jgi:hypothetical protein